MTHEIDLLRNARPIVAVPSTALRDEQRRQLLAAITPVRERRLGRRPLGALVAAAAALAAVAFVLAGSGSRGGEAWASSVVRVAESAPRLVVGATGWKVTGADQFSADTGEVTFADANRQVELRWSPLGDYAKSLVDYNASAKAVGTTSVLGARAQIFRYEDGGILTALWVFDSHTLQLEGDALDLSSFETVLASLQTVDVDSWLSAMPASVVLPGSHNDVVRGMLADIPLPPGVDRSQFASDSARDHYQLSAQVVGAVSCGWIEQWIAAKRTGNARALAESVAAMGAVASSSVLRQMDSGGAYPTVVREYASAIARGGNVIGRYAIGDQTVEESYRSTLGCSR